MAHNSGAIINPNTTVYVKELLMCSYPKYVYGAQNNTFQVKYNGKNIHKKGEVTILYH